MALVRVNVDGNSLACDMAALQAALRALPPGAPVVVMLHGYRFAPGIPGSCPHDHILSLRPAPGSRRVRSWPRHLGLGGHEAGLAVAFGWPALGTIWGAYDRAGAAGAALAGLITLIRRIDASRPVDAIAHSLGARVVLQALPRLAPGDLGQAILLAAAEFRGPTETALASPAGRAAEIVNVTSRENDLFDFFLETLVGGSCRTSIGQGLARHHPNWTDLQIDQPATAAALRRLGFRLGPAGPRICHWSPYLRPGLFPVYRALLARSLHPATLRACLPAEPDARWSRLLPIPAPAGQRLRLPGNPA